MSSPTDVRAQWAAHHPGLDTSPMEVVALLKHATGLLAKTVEPLYEGAPLTVPETDMLIPLRYATGPVIARGLADRRAALVTITPAGAEAIDALFPRQLAAEVELLAGLGEDRDWVLRALGRLVEAMESAASRG